jgi:hypothetical protein
MVSEKGEVVFSDPLFSKVIVLVLYAKPSPNRKVEIPFSQTTFFIHLLCEREAKQRSS